MTHATGSHVVKGLQERAARALPAEHVEHAVACNDDVRHSRPRSGSAPAAAVAAEQSAARVVGEAAVMGAGVQVLVPGASERAEGLELDAARPGNP
ncbi:hypothetical protein [Microtetraspora glauca]|uniref:Uncharacterized protein n=1 Tax=Microtetraspora glauca TaxID=1996 RepID=A0ABV3GKV5_MICGL